MKYLGKSRAFWDDVFFDFIDFHDPSLIKLMASTQDL